MVRKSYRKDSVMFTPMNGLMIDLPAPTNLSYLWNFGSLLGFCLLTQVVTGVFLAMHYSPDIELAFASVEHITRDINHGFTLSYLHANGASMYFLCVYFHIGRGMYYGSALLGEVYTKCDSVPYVGWVFQKMHGFKMADKVSFLYQP